MTLHVLGFPHTETTREFSTCAYTDRTRVFASMMTRAGYDVRLYGGETNEAQVTEHIPLVTRREQRDWWPWYDGKGAVFNDFDPESEGWQAFNQRAISAIRERMQPQDILCVTMGTAHRPVADALPLMAVETGIGYSGVFAPYRVFESYAWMHYLAAREPTDDARLFDAVIPRAWEVQDFPAGKGDGGYFLYIGRVMGRKGPQIAAETCQRLGAKLLVAGQGVSSAEPGRIVADDGTILRGDVEYVGVVGPEERARLMGSAIAVFVPTTYLEPLGGVAIEAMLTGTPAITTDYGAFTETVQQGETGFRCSTLADFTQAAQDVSGLERSIIRDYAQERFGTETVSAQFDAYFRRLSTLWGDGWYAAAA